MLLPNNAVIPRLLVPLVLAGCLGCASASNGGGPLGGRLGPPARPEVVQLAELELHGLLLLLEDRQLYDAFTVERALEGGKAVRERLAFTLGRLGDRRGVAVLKALLLDDEPAVRRAAAFSLGRLGDGSAAPNLLRASVDADAGVGLEAVTALAAVGQSVVGVGEKLAELPQPQFWARLLPALHRFRGEGRLPLARLGLLQVTDRDLRQGAAYALLQEVLQATDHAAAAELAVDLRPLLDDGDPRVPAWAAQGLGRVGSSADLERLFPLLADADPGPVIQALRAAQALILSGRAAAPAAWKPRLLELVTDPRPGVRLTALEAAGAWLLDEELGAVLVARAEGSEATPVADRWTALLALARARHPRATDLTAAAVTSQDPALRAHAADAAAVLDMEAALRTLLEDPQGRVRGAAWGAWLRGVDAEAALAGSGLEPLQEKLRTALADADLAVRGQALAWLADYPLLPPMELYAAIQDAQRDRAVEPRLSGIRALVARARVEAAEEENVVKALGRLAADRHRVVRRQAVQGLADLGRPAPPVGPQDTGKSAAVYEEIALRTARPRQVEIRTERGVLRVELFCPQVPFTCLNFLQLAEQGFYDGLTFHQRLPDAVVQTGDPRGDGWGGPGYEVRDEVSPRAFERGSLGMAISVPDTAGSQFFVTLSRQPGLDASYTLFGRVISGEEVLAKILPEDRLETVRPLP